MIAKKYSGNGAVLLGDTEWPVRYEFSVEQQRGALSASGSIDGIDDPGDVLDVLGSNNAKLRLSTGKVVDVVLLQGSNVIGDGRLKLIVNSNPAD